MPISTEERPSGATDVARVRIAAAGDVHCGEGTDTAALAAGFADAAARADVILLAGDLTTHGEPDNAALLVDACRDLDVPVVCVLGNHDHHSGRGDEVAEVLREGGIEVLDRSHRILDVDGTHLGIAGVKGFVGGFSGSHLPDFGEPLLRQVYAEGMQEVAALDEALKAVALCPLRVALMHYAPTTDTLVGERETIWTFLGTDRLAVPIREHCPDVVLHGHAHAGTFEGRIGEVPVHNVAVPLMGQPFWVFELSATSAPSLGPL
jgi:Icc-related predicted phosphoesterase